MPSVAIVGTAPAPPEHLDRSLFKSHKALPRKTHVLQTVQCLPIKPAGQDAVPPTAPSLPLTPPRVSPQDTHPNDGTKQNVVSPAVIEGVISPKPSHPPTPESTPPRRTPTNRRPGLSHGGRSSCSSREDSFQTAREMFSDSEPDTPRRSVQCLLPKTFRRSEAGTPEPRARADQTASTGSPKPKSKTKPRTSAKTRRAANPEPSTGTSARALSSAHQTAPRATDLASSSEGPVTSLSIEQFREQVGWPPGGGADLPEPDGSRRSSGISTASTVEVMIIDPPPARHSLRHSEKRSSLRSTSSPVTKSERASTSSHSDAHHRLVRKIGRISDSDRRSIASEISASEMSTFSGVASPQVEVVPVVVIPERRSSLKSSVQSSAPSSRDPSKVDASRRSRRRSGSRTESLDQSQSQSRRRTRSPSSARSTQSAFGQPVVPLRSSSLSAPTSRNNSRSTSLTSESLRHHTVAMDAVPGQSQPSQKLAERELPSTDVPRTQSILIGVEDMAHLHSPAATATHPSFPSLSPGPIEINEAITVAFFPHNNESILLVDPQVREEAERQASQQFYQGITEQPRSPEMQMQCNAGSPLVNPRSPPEPPAACKVIPPTVVSATDDLTPATTNLSRAPTNLSHAPTTLAPAGTHLSPAATNLTPTTTNLSRTATNDTNPGPFRRVASARRPRIRPGSESFHSFVRSLSLRSAENRKAGQEIDHNLHPFWRPRRFWPESSEPEDDSPREESMRFRDTDPDNVISNSLGMPQQRVAFNGPPPPSLHRPAPRPSDIATPYSADTNRHTVVETSVFSPEAFRSQTSFHQDRFRSVSWWRLRLRLGNVRNVRKRLRRTFQKRAEGKREARREKLKQSIGEMKLLGSSTRGIAQWWHGLPDNP